MTVGQILELLTQGGVVGLLVLIVVGGWRRWYVWQWQYRDMQNDRDWWRKIALRGTGLAEVAADAAEKRDA